MLLIKNSDKGTESDGCKSEEYCAFCYQQGQFVQEITVEELIEHNLQDLDDWNRENGLHFTEQEARAELQKFLPTLKLSLIHILWPGIAPRSRLYSTMQIRFLYVTFPACLIAWRIRSSARGSILPATVIPAARIFLNGLHASRGTRQ